MGRSHSRALVDMWDERLPSDADVPHLSIDELAARQAVFQDLELSFSDTAYAAVFYVILMVLGIGFGLAFELIESDKQVLTVVGGLVVVVTLLAVAGHSVYWRLRITRRLKQLEARIAQ